MKAETVKNIAIACMLMVLFSALLNGVLINLLLQPSHLLLVEQLSTKLFHLVAFLAISIAVLLLIQPTTKWQH